jgi:hypothetical protein
LCNAQWNLTKIVHCTYKAPSAAQAAPTII